MKIRLGVNDIPYAGNGKNGSVSTGQVAEWLEDKYGVMNFYVENHGDWMAQKVENSLAGVLESLAMGAHSSTDPFGSVTSAIEADFRHMIDKKEMDAAGIPGIPTKASLKGVDHRKKNRKGTPGRPSFRDTGLYQATFKVVIE